MPVFNFLSGKSEKIETRTNTEESQTIFYLRNKKLEAQMIVENDGFKVLKGSQVNLETSSSISSGWKKLREKLRHNEILTSDGSFYIFTEDCLFSSPSAASSVILGRQSAGPLEWIDTNKKSYKDYETENMED